MLQNYFAVISTSTNAIHDYNTRNSEFNFALRSPKTNSIQRSFAYMAAEANEIMYKYPFTN